MNNEIMQMNLALAREAHAVAQAGENSFPTIPFAHSDNSFNPAVILPQPPQDAEGMYWYNEANRQEFIDDRPEAQGGGGGGGGGDGLSDDDDEDGKSITEEKKAAMEKTGISQAKEAEKMLQYQREEENERERAMQALIDQGLELPEPPQQTVWQQERKGRGIGQGVSDSVLEEREKRKQEMWAMKRQREEEEEAKVAADLMDRERVKHNRVGFEQMHESRTNGFVETKLAHIQHQPKPNDDEFANRDKPTF